MKLKIKSIAKSQDKEWNGKILRKRWLTFEDGQEGELTLWPDNPEPTEGEEIEATISDPRGYGNEVKIERPGGGKPGGGGTRKTPETEAMINTIAVLKSCLESSQLEPKHIKGFVEVYHPWFMEFSKSPAKLTEVELGMPENAPNPTADNLDQDDSMPF